MNPISRRRLMFRRPVASAPAVLPGPLPLLGSAACMAFLAGYGVTESGGQVGTWVDQVQGIAVTQASSSLKPIVSATSFRGDQAGLTFDGVDDFLSGNSVGTLPTGTAPFEIWVLFDQTASPADADLVRDAVTVGGTSNNTYLGFRRTVLTSTNRGRVTTGGMNITDAGTPGPIDLTGRHWARVYYDGTNIGISVDGNSVTSTAAPSQITGNTRVRVGNTATGTTTGWTGVIAEIIVTNAILGGSVITDLNNYYSGKV